MNKKNVQNEKLFLHLFLFLFLSLISPYIKDRISKIYCQIYYSGLAQLKPDIVITNGGGARLKIGGKITMSHKDLLKLIRLLPDSKIVAVHMNSINHCFDTKEKLIDILKNQNTNIIIPENKK